MGNHQRQKIGILLVLPVLVLIILFGIVPFVQAIHLAFYDAGLRHKEFVGLDNFRHLGQLMAVRRAFRNTIGYAIITVPLSTIMALIIALAASEMKRGAFIRIAFYVPNLIAPVIIAAVWKWVFTSNGLINGLLQLMGLKGVSWLNSNPEAFFTISIIHIMGGLGLSILIYMAAISQIPRTYYEEATMSGATEFQKAIRISVPILMPVTGYLFIIKTLGAFQTWETIWMLTKGGPVFGTTTLVYQVYRYTVYEDRLGLGSAVGLVIMVLIGSLMAVQVFILRKRLR
jgi:multiple sugar transport system permease protein